MAPREVEDQGPGEFPGVAMVLETVFGVALAGISLGLVIFLTFWSRRIIERIHAHSPGSLRQIQKDINGGDRR